MHVCFIGHAAKLEGSERSLLSIIDYLSNKPDFSISVVLPNDGPFSAALHKRGIRVDFLPFNRWSSKRVYGHGQFVSENIATAHRIAELIQDCGAGLVYSNTAVNYVGALAAIIAGKPHVWHIREAIDSPALFRNGASIKEIAAFIECTGDAIIFNSEFTKGQWNGFFGEKPIGRCIYNYIAPPPSPKSIPHVPAKRMAPLTKTKSTCRIIVLGTILPWKNQIEAVRALKQLRDDRIDAQLVIVGSISDKEYHSEIIRFAKNNALDENVTFTGYKDDIVEELIQADISLVCSKKEPFGRVTIESMLQGVPVIGADQGGTAEIITHEKDGLLYNPGDIADLVANIKRITMDSEFSRRLVANARVTAGKYSRTEYTLEPIARLCMEIASSPSRLHPLSDSFKHAAYCIRTSPRYVARKIASRLLSKGGRFLSFRK